MIRFNRNAFSEKRGMEGLKKMAHEEKIVIP